MPSHQTSGGERPARRNPRGARGDRSADEFEQKILDLSRVTRVTAGGKRMRFRACVAIGDRKGRVAVGLAKGADVSTAITKATNQAKKNFLTVPIEHETIPHDILVKFKAAKLLLKPAPRGTGIIAGGVVRLILDLAGVPNVVAKILGSSNRVTNAKATMKAIAALRARSS
ncbi:MAG: 30S ribosomal protein S5 [Candidatus Uhrbacteria bacterium]